MWPDFKDLLKAYKECRMGKPASAEQTQFETRLGENLLLLLKEIQLKTYLPSQAKCFIVPRPKPREIFAAHFRDRIVHHLIVSKLTPFWESRFSDASFACRKDRGTHGALQRLLSEIKRVSRQGEVKLHVLKLDIASFFATIHRGILCGLLQEENQNPLLSFLIRNSFGHDSRDSFIFQGKKNLSNLIPLEKSWLSQESHRGLPIGNLTSQFGANVYLNECDHWIENHLRPASYIRYMDDFLFLDSNPKKLLTFESQIDAWLKKHRGQQLNLKKTKCHSLTEGVSYLGYRVIQKRKDSRMHQVLFPKAKKWAFIKDLKHLEKTGLPPLEKLHFLSPTLSKRKRTQRLSSLQSRLGLMKHASTRRFRKRAGVTKSLFT